MPYSDAVRVVRTTALKMVAAKAHSPSLLMLFDWSMSEQASFNAGLRSRARGQPL